MPLWRLEPNARLHDPRWQKHDFRQPVLVDASNPAIARRKATKWYIARHGAAENNNQFQQSAFEDEKLYRVERIDVSPYQPETLEDLVGSVYPYISEGETPSSQKRRARH